MPAAYDTYDYPSYWSNREYEHKAEIVALKDLLSKIPKIDKILEIGSGYGRLTPAYIHRSKKVILSDPSARLLSLSQKTFRQKKIKFIQTTAENLPKKVRSKSVDLVICIRVSHHIKDIDLLFTIVNKILTDGGHFILEYPNKRHIKALFSEFMKGNFTFGLDIFSKDIRSKKAKQQTNLPFINYHPDTIRTKLESHGFKIKEERSVSNLRIPFLKDYLSTNSLIYLEKKLVWFFSAFLMGPSIFVLAQKKS